MPKRLKYLVAIGAVAVIAIIASTTRTPAPADGSGQASATGRTTSPSKVHGLQVVRGGTATFHFQAEALDSLGLSMIVQSTADDVREDNRAVFAVSELSTLAIETTGSRFRDIAGGEIYAPGALLVISPRGRELVGNFRIMRGSDGVYAVVSAVGDVGLSEVVFELTSVAIDFNAPAGELSLVGELRIAYSWAQALGMPHAADTALGSLVIEADTVPSDDVPTTADGIDRDELPVGGSTRMDPIGPDVVIADLPRVHTYGEKAGDITACIVGTLACNYGDERASWISNNNRHPLILSNMYRLKDDRFEQIGMSWVKHGFYAVSENFCDLGGPDPYNCLDPTDGSSLGVGCSDPYDAELNGRQDIMSPRSYAVNAHTGYFQYPWPGWEGGPGPDWPEPTATERRLQLHDADIDPALNAEAIYFVEAQYIHPDDADAGTHDNNVSYRRVSVTEPSQGYYLFGVDPSYSTQREQPGIRAWQDEDPTVVETDIRVPVEGLFILAAKATDLGTGFWRYSYALENLNSDRSAGSFSVPLFPGMPIENIGFHDVDYHSGDVYDPTDWPETVEPFAITWATDSYDVNPDANAMRYATVYSFHFDAESPPVPVTVTIGLFKPGLPTELTGDSIGPDPVSQDCNENGVPDLTDIQEGTSSDCDGNLVPDECQPDCNENDVADPCDILFGTSNDCNDNDIPDECETDCNENGFADECDIAGGTSNDCQPNGIPDECEPDCDGDGIPTDCDDDEDTDNDDVDDCLDQCPYTTPEGVSCVCPEEPCCDKAGWPPCFVRVTPDVCTGVFGGVSECVPGDLEYFCNHGCLWGDFDKDGDIDLADFAALQVGFSGPSGTPGYVPPAADHRFAFDREFDTDIDLFDWEGIQPDLTGPTAP